VATGAPTRRVGWRRRLVTVMVGWGLYAVAITLVALAARARHRALVLAACVLLALVGMAFQRELGRRSVGTGARLLSALAVLVAGAGAIWFWRRGGATEGWGFLGLTTILFGVAQLLTLWRHGHRLAGVRGIVLVGFGAAAMLAGLFGLGAQRPGPALTAFVVGLALGVVGLLLGAEDVLRHFSRRPPDRLLLVLLGLFGLAILGTALAGFVQLGAPLRYALIITVLVTVLVGSLASDNDADVIIVVIVLMISWSLLPRDSPPLRLEPGDGSVLVAFGDSLISGEGAQSYYRGTNTKGDNQCRRAPTAYPPNLAAGGDDLVPDRVLFVACSGAKSRHIHLDPQYEGDPLPELLPPVADGRGRTQLGQYDEVARTAGIDVGLVLVSIGGNDASFGDLAQTCVGPGDCSETGQRWLAALPAVAEKVAPAYAAIAERFPNAPVLVVPYPLPLNETGCSGSLLTAREHRFLSGFTAELNELLRREAARAGFHFADNVRGVFERHRLRLCDDDFGKVGVNFFAANPVSGLLEEAISPQNWFHNSLHPNPRGHPRLEEAIAEWVGTHQPLAPRAAPAEPEPYPVARVEAVMGDDAYAHCASPVRTSRHCRFDAEGVLNTSRWTQSHGVDLLRRVVFPLLATLVGGFLLWIALIAFWRRARWVRALTASVQQRLAQ
jgi:GDSL-like Lipase/Acylhydrolase family